jgi:hypothetical protein
MQIKPLIEPIAQPDNPIEPPAWRTISANEIQQCRSQCDLRQRQILEPIYNQLELKLKQITKYRTPAFVARCHGIAVCLPHISFPDHNLRILIQRLVYSSGPTDRALTVSLCLYDPSPLTVSGTRISGSAQENVAELRAKQMKQCLAGTRSCVHNGIIDVVSTVFLVPGRVA